MATVLKEKKDISAETMQIQPLDATRCVNYLYQWIKATHWVVVKITSIVSRGENAVLSGILSYYEREETGFNYFSRSEITLQCILISDGILREKCRTRKKIEMKVPK